MRSLFFCPNSAIFRTYEMTLRKAEIGPGGRPPAEKQGTTVGRSCAAGVATFEPFIGKAEVAKRLGKPMRTVNSWMQQGLLPYYKIGRSVCFKWSEVEQHLKELCHVCQ